MTESDRKVQAPGPGISAFVVCHNEVTAIRRCLDSVRWCDEIVVIDSGSTDGTVEACKEYTDKVFHRNWPGYIQQKQRGLDLCTKDWVINIDADEEVSPELKEEIVKVVSNNPTNEPDVNGYSLSRVVFYLDRWWRKGGWYPEYRLRLLRRSCASWGGMEPHEHAIVTGKTRKLRGELRHFTYANLEDHVERLLSHATTAALHLFERGDRTNLFQIIFNPIARFFKFYVIKKGFLEGIPGLIVACLESYYVFVKYVRLWELGRISTSSKTKEDLSNG